VPPTRESAGLTSRETRGGCPKSLRGLHPRVSLPGTHDQERDRVRDDPDNEGSDRLEDVLFEASIYAHRFYLVLASKSACGGTHIATRTRHRWHPPSASLALPGRARLPARQARPSQRPSPSPREPRPARERRMACNSRPKRPIIKVERPRVAPLSLVGSHEPLPNDDEEPQRIGY
jgi:hypothetical protein